MLCRGLVGIALASELTQPVGHWACGGASPCMAVCGGRPVRRARKVEQHFRLAKRDSRG